MTSQVGHSHLCTSCHVFVTFQFHQFHLGNSWYIAMISQIGPRRLRLNETKVERHYDVAYGVGT